MKEIRIVWFDLYNPLKRPEEKRGERRVGIHYIRENGVDKDLDAKIERLRNDYPLSEGYELAKLYDELSSVLEP